MKKNGFTLIEILGVITLLALLSIIVIISVSKSLKDSIKTLSSVQIESIKSAAGLWRTDNIELVPDTGYYVLSIGDLIDQGYISEVTDIDSGYEYDRDILVTVGINEVLVGNETDSYVASTYGCNNTTVFCIKDRSDMEKLAKEVIGGDNKSGKTYKLIKNIDLGGKFDSDGNPLEGNNPWTPIGSEAKPFSGTFDGTGHIITGMYIDSIATKTGLFSVVDGGTIQNMGIEDSYVKSNQEYTGSFVGKLKRGGYLLDCSNGGTVSGVKSSAGLVGYTTVSSFVKNCYNSGSISSNDNQFAGGIVGYNSDSNIENCYNVGEITGGLEIGGIVGGNNGYAKNIYNLGYINSLQRHGGIAGQHYGKIIENSYNSGDLGLSDRGGIIGKIHGNSNQQLINNYYLNTTADYGILNSTNDNFEPNSDNGTTPLSASEMPSVISVINGDGAFVPDTKGINNGYPILSWQQ